LTQLPKLRIISHNPKMDQGRPNFWFKKPHYFFRSFLWTQVLGNASDFYTVVLNFAEEEIISLFVTVAAQLVSTPPKLKDLDINDNSDD
jgi:hypothetical protein